MSDTDWKQVRAALEGMHDMAVKVGGWDQVRQIAAQIKTADAIIDLLRRVKALEDGSPRIHGTAASAAAESPVGASSEEGAAGTTEERAAIARVRRQAKAGVFTTPVDVRHVLAALDRATAERDGWEKDARNLAMAHHDAHKRIRDLDAQVAHYRLSWESAERTINLLRADLRAQLAARTDAKPSWWVNVYPSLSDAIHRSEESARAAASSDATRVAVPGYEHAPRPVAPKCDCHLHERQVCDVCQGVGGKDTPDAPRPVAPVSDLDIIRALEGVFDMHQESILARQCVTALRPLFDRAAASAPAMQVVGACVVREGKAERVWGTGAFRQSRCEELAKEHAPGDGGTAHRLYRDTTPLTTDGAK